MGLSIKNANVERMIRDLAARRGVSMTEAVRQALAHELERDAVAREAEIEVKMAELMAITRELASLPVLDDRTPDEIIGYDENGLPT